MGFGANYSSQDVLRSFLLVLAAGAATGIGAAVVFVPRVIEYTSKKALAASLGFSAGAMIFISLVDIYQTAIDGFEKAGHGSDDAFIYSTLGFFAGVLLMKVGLREKGGLSIDRSIDRSINQSFRVPLLCPFISPSHAIRPQVTDLFISLILGDEQMPDMIHFFNKQETVLAETSTQDHHQGHSSHSADDDEEAGISSAEERQTEETAAQKKLVHMGIAAAVAIFLHNLPEGAVTFASYMDDPSVGVVLAFAIGIHNIPEGLCVAMPIYFATHNRWKAFWWGILSGVSEPFGALIVYFVLGGSFSGNTNGILFSMLAGIMTMLSMDELLPSAHRYDPENKVVTSFLVLGMFVVGMSLVLFSL